MSVGNTLPEDSLSVQFADACIACIAQCVTETDVQHLVATILRHFEFESYVFVVLVRNGMREHYRYLLGCDPGLCYRYFQNKWYAIDPFIDYALRNTSPVLTADVPNKSAGQKRMRQDAEANGFRNGIAVPAHGSSSSLVGVLYFGTDAGPDHARRSLVKHRNLMRALALELLEWWNARLCTNGMMEFNLDRIDIELLCNARDRTNSKDAAAKLGLTPACVIKRYERLRRKLGVTGKRHAVFKAIEFGLITPAA